MKESTKEYIFGMLIVSALLLVVGALIYFAAVEADAREAQKASQAKAAARTEFEQEAAAHGAGEYIIADPKTEAVEFRWKEPK